MPPPALPPEVWSQIYSFLPSPSARTTFCLLSRPLSLIGLRASLSSLTIFRHPTDFSMLTSIARNPAHAALIRSLTYIPFTLDEGALSDYERFVEHYRARGLGRVWRLYRPLPSPAEMMGYYCAVEQARKCEEAMREYDLERMCFEEVLPKLEWLREVWMWNGTGFHVESVTVRDIGRTLVEKTPFDGTGLCLWPGGQYPGTGVRGMRAMMGGLEGCKVGGMRELHVGPVDWEWVREMPRLGIVGGLAVLDLQFELTVREDESFESRLAWCRMMLEGGLLADFLAAIPGLRDLAVRSTPRRKAMLGSRSVYPAELQQVIKPGHQWPNLRFLALGSMHATSKGLREVLDVHRETLRRLDLGFVGLDKHWMQSGLLLEMHEQHNETGLEVNLFGFLDGPWKGHEPGEGYELQWLPSSAYDYSHAADYGMQQPRWRPAGGGRLADFFDGHNCGAVPALCYVCRDPVVIAESLRGSLRFTPFVMQPGFRRREPENSD